LSYSVTESNGVVEITILKKENTSDYTFGVRTTKGSATVGKDYEAYDQSHTFEKKDIEMKI
jgi:solute carrier family 8 (sodium/calcium exchanger)